MPEMTIQPWKSRPVFISSTFKDMQAERDHLKNVVFPELAERLRGRRNHLDSIDLRLGVETVHVADEAAKELLVLKVCLTEIERSRPFLIVLLGDRYGWVPPRERMEAAAREAGFETDVAGRSVTDLEIDFGLLKKDPAQRRRSFFYFREPLPYDRMPPDAAARYSDLHSPDPDVRANHEKLRKLKERITDDPELKPRVRPYKAEWNAATNEVSGLHAWGRQVLDDLWGELDQETAAQAAGPGLTWEELERAALTEFVELRGRNFIGRVGLTNELLAFARSPASDEADWGWCLTGEPGAGKSALFAHVHQQLQESPDVFVLAHAAGISTRAGQVDSMLGRWIQELADHLGIAPPLDDSASAEDIEKAFAELLGRASTQRRVVLLIDALNQFAPSTRAAYLTWLPPLLPPNVRLIATAIAGTESEALGRRRGTRLTGLDPLSLAESREIATAICEGHYHREFHDAIYAAVLARKLADGRPAAGNPLWLWLAMEELNLLDADAFAQAERDYAALPADRRLHQLLLDTVESFPANVEGLYAWMLRRSERVFGRAVARAFAGLIAVSRSGWRESDLRARLPGAAALFADNTPLPPVDDLLLASLRRSFRAHVVRRGELDQWDFLHLQMRKAVRRHCLQGDDLARRLHAAIADYLETLTREDPLHISEIMFHYIGADDRLRAARYYGSALTTAAESAGTDVLAAHLLAEPGDSGSGAIEWVAGLPGQPGLTPDEQASICRRFNFDLDDRLATTAPLAIRQSILQAAQVVLTNLATSDPGNAGWQRDLAVSHYKLAQWAQNNDPGSADAHWRKCYEVLRRMRADGMFMDPPLVQLLGQLEQTFGS